MRTHATDLVALLFGLVFVVTGAAFLIDELSDDAIDPAWVFAVGFVTFGMVALAVTLFRGRDNEVATPTDPTERAERAEPAEPGAAS